MNSPYRIFPLSLGPEATLRSAQASETMGSKEKVWLVHAKSELRVMLKFARPGTGEDWSERVAFEIARHMGIPCPRVELAAADGRPAVLCWDFLRYERDVSPRRVRRRALIHGNELLLQRDPAYPVVCQNPTLRAARTVSRSTHCRQWSTCYKVMDIGSGDSRSGPNQPTRSTLSWAI